VYAVWLVREGESWVRLGLVRAGIHANLRVWYSFMKLGGYRDKLYYLVGDAESLEVFKMAYESYGFKVARVKELEGTPWYLAGIAERLAEDAVEKAVARAAFEPLKLVFSKEKTVRQVAEELAGRLGLDPGKAYRAVLKAKTKLAISVLVEARPINADPWTLKRLAIRVGLVPLAEDASARTVTFYSGRFMRLESAFDGLLSKLDVTRLEYDRLSKALYKVAKMEYGRKAREVAEIVMYSKAYQELLARLKAEAVALLVKMDYKVFTLR